MDSKDFIELVRQEIKTRSCCSMILSKKKQRSFKKWFLDECWKTYQWDSETSMIHYNRIKQTLNWK